jgi:beta-glucuronidase
VLDYADRRGLVLIDETAAVGLNMGLGGGIFGGQGYQTYSPATVNDVTQAVHAQAIRELVARDKNHPSVVLWSIANEPESETEGAEDYFRPLFDVAREADPTRPVGFVNVMLAPHGTCRVSQFADVLMLNRYYGWYVNTGDLPAAERALEAELHAWAAKLGKPIIMTGYGADTLPGLHSVIPAPWTEEHQAELLAMSHGVFRPGRCRRRRTGLELRHLVRGNASRRQQERRFRPRPAVQGQRTPAAAPLVRAALTSRRPGET